MGNGWRARSQQQGLLGEAQSDGDTAAAAATTHILVLTAADL